MQPEPVETRRSYPPPATMRPRCSRTSHALLPLSYDSSRQCLRDGAMGVQVPPPLRRINGQAARMLWSWSVMQASDRGGCTGLFVGIAVTIHRSHLSSPGSTVSSGAFFDELGRLHHVRLLHAYSALFQIRVRYGFEASSMEFVIVRVSFLGVAPLTGSQICETALVAQSCRCFAASLP